MTGPTTPVGGANEPAWLLSVQRWSGRLLASFLLFHLWAGYGLLWDRAGFESTYELSALPPVLRSALLLVGVFIPLGLHAGCGAWLLAGQLRAGVASKAGVRRRLLGVTGLFLLGFLAYHLSGWGRLVGPNAYDELTKQLSTTSSLGVPFCALLYTLGSLLALGHAGYGLSTAQFSSSYWRQPWVRRALIALICLSILPLWLAVLHFATGWP